MKTHKHTAGVLQLLGDFLLAGVPDFMAALSVLFQAGILEPAARPFLCVLALHV